MSSTLQVTTPYEREIVIRRGFDAPRAPVWEAHTRPDLLGRWLAGPPGWGRAGCDEHLPIGGTFRWEWRGPNGEQMVMHGEYSEVIPCERVVRSETLDTGCGAQAGEQIATLPLAERGGETTLGGTVRSPSRGARGGSVASRMEQGMDRGTAAGDGRLDRLPGSSVRRISCHPAI